MQIGSLAELVSGLATAGSLFLGFSILLRDRRKDDQAEAIRVVTWFVNQPDGTVHLNISNRGSRPIMHVMFCLASVDERQKSAALWRMLDVAPVLASGEDSSLQLPFREFHANALYPSYVQFRDANGISWRRTCALENFEGPELGQIGGSACDAQDLDYPGHLSHAAEYLAGPFG